MSFLAIYSRIDATQVLIHACRLLGAIIDIKLAPIEEASCRATLSY